MVAISHLLVVLTAILPSSFAAPTELVDAVPALDKRGDFNFVLDDSHPLALARRNLSERSTNYVQNYQTGGTVNFSPSNGKFSVNWNTRNDFVVGVGWNPGSAQPITHSGSFSVTSGLGSLSVYGWTTNPLIEYYVIESLQGWSQNGQQMGTVTTDGGTYTIWKHQQVNQPSIEGTSTFWQYISVRNSPRTSGTVTLANHFNAWKSHGMNLGKMNFQVIAVETWNGAGSATQTVSN